MYFYQSCNSAEHHWKKLNFFSVADLGFPRRGANPRGRGKNLLFGKIFAKNCIKMKEFGPRGRARPWLPLGSANAFNFTICFVFIFLFIFQEMPNFRHKQNDSFYNVIHACCDHEPYCCKIRRTTVDNMIFPDMA